MSKMKNLPTVYLTNFVIIWSFIKGTTFSDESETWTRYLHSDVYMQQVQYHSKGKALKMMSKRLKSTNSIDKSQYRLEKFDNETSERRNKKKKVEKVSCQSLPIQIVVSSVKSLAKENGSTSTENNGLVQ